MCFLIGGAILGGALIGSLGSEAAANTQANADQQASQIQQNMFNTINGQEQPFMQGGYTALGELMNGFSSPSSTGSTGITSSSGTGMNGYTATPSGGIQGVLANAKMPLASANPIKNPYGSVPTANSGSVPASSGSSGGVPAGYFTQTFNPNSMASNPAYQFAVNQGNQAVTNSNTPSAGALSGSNAKALENFDVGTANQWENQYYNQFTQNQNNIFSRLSAIAGLGQNAATQVGNNGAQLGTGIAQSTAASGAATAGGIVGATNAASNGLTTAAMINALNPTPQSPASSFGQNGLSPDNPFGEN